jgi:transposase
VQVETGFDFLEELSSSAKNFLADKGYDSDLFRKCLSQINRTPVIPGRKSRKIAIEYNKEIYRERYVVGNTFCRLKQFRSIATRYEKLAKNFLSMVYMACSLCWLKF